MVPNINKLPQSARTGIYPGAYCAIPASAAAVKKALRNRHTRIIEPPVSIKALPDHYRIELVVPGLHKEDFFVTTSNSKLSVSAISKQPMENEGMTRYAVNRPACFRRIMLLPADADPDFAEAGYQDGILHICLFKTSSPGRAGTGRIVVY